MARLPEPPSFYGTVDGLCVYRLNGRDYVRTASSLSGDRVKTAPEFRHTMLWAGRLKAASRLASAVYALLPAERRKHALYRKLTGMAMRGLKEGKDGREIVEEMMRAAEVKRKRAPKPVRGNGRPTKPVWRERGYDDGSDGSLMAAFPAIAASVRLLYPS